MGKQEERIIHASRFVPDPSLPGVIRWGASDLWSDRIHKAIQDEQDDSRTGLVSPRSFALRARLDRANIEFALLRDELLIT